MRRFARWWRWLTGGGDKPEASLWLWRWVMDGDKPDASAWFGWIRHDRVEPGGNVSGTEWEKVCSGLSAEMCWNILHLRLDGKVAMVLPRNLHPEQMLAEEGHKINH